MKILYKPVSGGGVSVSYPQPIPMQPVPMQPIPMQPVQPVYPMMPGPGHYMPGQAPHPGKKRWNIYISDVGWIFICITIG